MLRALLKLRQPGAAADSKLEPKLSNVRPASSPSPPGALKISLVRARLVLTSSPRSEIELEGPATLSQGPQGKTIRERVPTNEVDPMCRVTVPTGSTVELDSEFGNLTVFNFDGTLRARLQSGNARIDHARGQLRVVASEGSVWFEQVSGRLDALTTRGNVEAHHVEGELQCVSENGSMLFEAINGPLVARTTTGSIKAEELVGVARLSTRSGELAVKGAHRQLTLRSQSGDIALDGAVVDHTTIETFKGRIEVRLWRNTDARIEASARQGVVRTERIALAPGSGRRTARSTIGAGRARLSLATGMGVIEITGPLPSRQTD